MVSELSTSDFREFFITLHDKVPFPWQESLAKQVCTGTWPEVIDLPTASGKTACLDIALFALAVTKQTPRRMFFVVDRRIIVNEAFDRMKKVAKKLAEAEAGVLASVAGALKDLAGGGSAHPLDVYQLRGGIYRDQSWVRTPLQPMVVTSTVDQIGSRLLFRGYGVSSSSAPIHAALIANDSLLFLDEAHCSRAFSQTLSSIRNYRSGGWAKTPLKKAFSFVEMTATPSQKTDVPFRLTEADDRDEVLKLRLYAGKPTTLSLIKGKAKDRESLAKSLAQKAIEMALESGAKRIAVMVNRVATARRVFEILGKHIGPENLNLLIGRMRPIDRDKLVAHLKPLKAGAVRVAESTPTYVVSTQCLEVGADLDFDILITECASIDALLQRFGRLDRLGECRGKAGGCIMTLSGIADSCDPDPIYGESLAKTWRWLNELTGDSKALNMGIRSKDSGQPTVAEALTSLPSEAADGVRRIGAPAPALLPSHLDALVQTSPKPHADPDVTLFLHGRQEGPPEIQVVWRQDLDVGAVDSWGKIVALCPPVSAEAMPVRLDQFRVWLSGNAALTEGEPDSDLEGAGKEEQPDRKQEQRVLQQALLWRGDKSEVVKSVQDVKPNDTVVLAFSQGGWEQFGHIPEPTDVAEEATQQARARIVFRIHEALWPQPIPAQLKELIANEEFDWNLWAILAADNLEFLKSRGVESADRKDFKRPLPYPVRRDERAQGWVLQGLVTIENRQVVSDDDEGNDEKLHADSPLGAVSLEEHTKAVVDAVQVIAAQVLPDFSATLSKAAGLHDAGKTDTRFQTMLHGGDHLAAAFYPFPLAKSDSRSSGLYQLAREKSGLPEHFRHELLSLQFAAKSYLDRADREWVLHLIASHHGYCRPFAPVILDHEPQAVTWEGQELSASERLAQPAHALSSGVARRFWRFTREFGWWGSAYLEACLRVADWRASEAKQERKSSK